MSRSTRQRGKAFSQEEDAFLRENYAEHGAAWCAAQLRGRTEGSVRNRAKRLSLTRGPIPPAPPPPAPAPALAVRKPGSFDLSFSLADRAPEGIEHLGKREDYGRVRPLGKPCEKHPTYTVGHFGCAACVAGERWAKRQREVKYRPHQDGGR